MLSLKKDTAAFIFRAHHLIWSQSDFACSDFMRSTQIVLSNGDAAFASCISNNIKRGKQDESCSIIYAAYTHSNIIHVPTASQIHLISRSVVPSSGPTGKALGLIKPTANCRILYCII